MKLRFSDAVRDYFYDFRNIFADKELFLAVVILGMSPVIISVMDIKNISSDIFENISVRVLYLIPVWFAYVSVITHRLSLTPAMYLVPMKVSDRERYISSLAVCKAVFPLVFTVVFDLVCAFFVKFTFWTAAVQLVSVVLPCVNGAINFENTKSGSLGVLYLTQPMLAVAYFSTSFPESLGEIPFTIMLVLNIISLCFTVPRWPDLRRFYSVFENIDARGEK